MEMTLEQRRAIALANARMRAAEAEAPEGVAPEAWAFMSDEEKEQVRQWAGDVHTQPQTLSTPEEERDFHIDRAAAERAESFGPGSRAAMPVAQGLSANFADEIVSGIAAPFQAAASGNNVADEYAINKRAMEQSLARERREHGGRALIGEIGGALATGAGVVGSGLSLTANAAARGAPMWTRGALAAGEGAGWGGLSAYGADEDVLTGLAGGAIIGPIAEAGGTGIAKAFRGIRGWIQPQYGATSKLARNLPDDALRAGQDLGPEGMVADVLPEQAESIGGIADDASKRLVGALKARKAGAGQRVTQTLDDALGAPANMHVLKTGQREARTQAANVAYGEAFENAGPVDASDVVMWLDGEIAGSKGGIKTALNRARDLMVRKTSMGDMIERDLDALHQAKMAIDDMLSGGSDSSLGNVARGKLRQAKNRLVAAMDDASPEYAAARQQFADDSAVMEALENGQSLFNRKVRPDELAEELRHMSADELDAFRRGARDQVAEIMGTARNEPIAARSMFDKGWNREKLAMVFGDDEASAIVARLDAEKVFDETANRAYGNSRTAYRQDARNAWKPAETSGMPLALEGVGTASGMPGAATAGYTIGKAKNAIMAGLLRGQRKRASDMLTLSGAKRDAMVRLLQGHRDPSIAGIPTIAAAERARKNLPAMRRYFQSMMP